MHSSPLLTLTRVKRWINAINKAKTQVVTRKLTLCADSKVNLRVNSEPIASKLNAVNGASSC